MAAPPAPLAPISAYLGASRTPSRLRGVELRHRRLLNKRLALLLHPRRVVHEQPRRVQLRRHLRHLRSTPEVRPRYARDAPEVIEAAGAALSRRHLGGTSAPPGAARPGTKRSACRTACARAGMATSRQAPPVRCGRDAAGTRPIMRPRCAARLRQPDHLRPDADAPLVEYLDRVLVPLAHLAENVISGNLEGSARSRCARHLGGISAASRRHLGAHHDVLEAYGARARRADAEFVLLLADAQPYARRGVSGGDNRAAAGRGERVTARLARRAGRRST